MAACDRCGEPNDDTARFCGACGAALPARSLEGLEVRKTVTILFCDVVGSTTLGEATDPETTRRVMSRYAQTMAEVVRQHGGTVERFRGDEVMAVFGIPAVHEDDALRAVRAAAEMLRRLDVLNAELRASFGRELQCRVGVNTGEVVAGDPGTGETFVTGDAVNLAKRLEQAAEPGTILIGTGTYPLVKDAVKVGPRERFTAKGKSQPVARLKLEGVDAAAAGIARRLDAPLVGRVRELERIHAVIDRHLDAGTCGVITIVGAAGIGKSRLARELAAQLGPRARAVFGRCLPYGRAITYWPLVELVRELGGADALSHELGGTDDAESVLERVRAAIGESDIVAPSDEIFWGVKRMLEGVSRTQPLLVCLEDLQWAEPTMLDLVEYIDAFAAAPIVLLCNARPELMETRPAWSRYPLLELGHLSDTETDELVSSLGIIDASVRDRISSTAEGNPLFAEQLAAMVAEGKHGPGEAIDLPGSIQALLAARLDSLDAEERRALERAAVVGREFWPRAVADLSPPPDRAQVAGRLLSLARKGLVEPVRSDVPGEDTFRFRHALIRDVAYAGMPKALRAELHASFANWLRTRSDDAFVQYDEIIGYHAERAYRYLVELGPSNGRADVLGRMAAEHLSAAGRRAFARDDMRAAANLLRRAADLMGADHPDRGDVLFQASGAMWSTGDRARADETLGEVIEHATARSDERLRWHALLERAARRSPTEEHALEELLRVAESARDVFAASKDELGLARAWRRIAVVHRLQSRFGAAAAAGEKALSHAVGIGDGREEGRIVDALCTALLYGPVPVEVAIERCQTLLSGERPQPSVEAAVLSSLSGLVAMRSDFDEARHLYRRAKRLWEDLGLRYAVAGLTQVGGEIELLANDPPAAERELREGAEILAELGGDAFQDALLAYALAEQGADTEAVELALRAERAPGGLQIQAEIVAGLALATLAMRSGRQEQALDHAQSAVQRSRDADAPNRQADSLVALARCLVAIDRVDEARVHLDEALRLYDMKGNRAARQLAITWELPSARIAE